MRESLWRLKESWITILEGVKSETEAIEARK